MIFDFVKEFMAIFEMSPCLKFIHVVRILYFAAIQSTNPYITHVAPKLEISHEFYQICEVHGDSDITMSKNKRIAPALHFSSCPSYQKYILSLSIFCIQMKIICKLRLNFEVLSALRIYLRYYKLFCIGKYLVFI